MATITPARHSTPAVHNAVVDAVRASLDADGRGTNRTVEAVAALVSDLAGGVRSAARAKAA